MKFFILALHAVWNCTLDEDQTILLYGAHVGKCDTLIIIAWELLISILNLKD